MSFRRFREISPGLVAWTVGLISLAIHAFIAARYATTPFKKYSTAAELFLDGKLAPERWIDFSPLYLQLMIALRSIVPDAERWLHHLQLGLTAATIAVVFLLFDRRLGRGWALAGVVVLIFDRQILIYERILEPEALFLFLAFLFLLLIDGPDGGPAHPIAAGTIGALGLAVRPTFLPLCLLALLLWGLNQRRALKAWIKPAVLFVAPLVLALGLLAIRADRATGSFRAPTMNPGTVFFEGNQPMSRGTSAVYPPLVHALTRNPDGVPDSAHVHYRAVARKSVDEPLSVSQVNRYWIERARAYWIDHPVASLSRLSTKLQYIFHSFRWHDLPAAWVYDQYLPVPGVPFALLSALALPGLLLEIRRRRDGLMLYALLGSQIAVMLIFYVSPRQRLILIPLFIYFGLVTVKTIVQERVAWPLLLALVLFPTFSLPDSAIRDEIYQRNHLLVTRQKLGDISTRLAAKEPMAALADDFADAIADTPWWLDGLQPAFVPRDGLSLERLIVSKFKDRGLSPFDRAELLIRVGDTVKARELLLQAIESPDRSYRQGRSSTAPELFLSRISSLEGRSAEARQWLSQALEQTPGEPYLLAELFAVTREPEHLELLERYYGRQNAHFLAGQAFMALGKSEAAIEHLTETVNAFPQMREPRIALAAALQRSGRWEQGLSHAIIADELQLEPVHYAEEIAQLYRSSAQFSKSPKAQLRAAQGLFHYGKPKEALAVLSRISSSAESAATKRLRSQLRDALRFGG